MKWIEAEFLTMGDNMREYTLLNLGCGQRYHKDWTNVDFFSNNINVLSINLLKGIPFPDASFDVVYHSHLLEHIPRNNSLPFLKECSRVLKPGGIIRVVVPDLENLVKEYLRVLNSLKSGLVIEEANYEWILLEILDQMVRTRAGGEMVSYLGQEYLANERYVYSRAGDEMKELHETLIGKSNSPRQGIKKKSKFISKMSFKKILNRLKKSVPIKEFQLGSFRMSGEVHQWMYDEYSLKKLLIKGGFEDIQIMNASDSKIRNWVRYELDIKNGIIHKPNSLFMEAFKSLKG